MASDRALIDVRVVLTRSEELIRLCVDLRDNLTPLLRPSASSYANSMRIWKSETLAMRHTPVLLTNFWDVLLNLIVKVSNNSSYEEKWHKFLEHYTQHGRFPHLKALLSMQGYRLECFRLALIKRASRARMFDVVRITLNQGVDPNGLFSQEWSHLAKPGKVEALLFLF